MVMPKFNRAKPAESDILQKLETRLRKLSDANLSESRRYCHDHVDARNFPEWLDYAKTTLHDSDAIRNALYYGFQPLYDSMISGSIPPESRSSALKVLDRLVEAGVKFLTGYYMGEPDPALFREALNHIQDDIRALGRDVRYTTKFRNVDYNGIYPPGIQSFLQQISEHSLDGKGFVPDYIVGCACGSSEVVMPLSGFFETDLGFLRRSWRRGDDDVRMVEEQEPFIKSCSNGKIVLCVEDYVCTGRSLQRVMNKVRGYGASSIKGASVNGPNGPDYLKSEIDGRKFHLYRLK